MAADFEGSGYRARVVQDLPAPTVADENADVFVNLADGRSYAGVLATTRNIEHLLVKFAADGQCARGAYLWISYLVVVRDFAPRTIHATIEDLVRTGDIERVFAVARRGPSS